LEFLPATIEVWSEEGKREARSEWNEFGKGKDENEVIKEFIAASDRRGSFDDIWTISTQDASLFEYCSCLRPAYFGLVLVRCKFKADGKRELELL